MEFIHSMSPEYRRILVKVTLLTPIIEPFLVKKGALLLLCVIPYLGLIIYGVPDGMDTSLYMALVVATPIAFALFLASVQMVLSLIFLFPSYIVKHRKFIAEIKMLDSNRYEKLLSEYPSAKKINMYYDKKKKVPAAETIMITESSLLVPGLFLVWKEEIVDIEIYGPTRSDITTFTFLLKKQKKKTLELYYRYDICPETAEQIMAWFWGDAQNGSSLKEKTKVWHDESQERRWMNPRD